MMVAASSVGEGALMSRKPPARTRVAAARCLDYRRCGKGTRDGGSGWPQQRPEGGLPATDGLVGKPEPRGEVPVDARGEGLRVAAGHGGQAEVASHLRRAVVD